MNASRSPYLETKCYNKATRETKKGGRANALSALNEGDALLGETARGGIQLEGPQELGHLAEALTASHQ